MPATRQELFDYLSQLGLKTHTVDHIPVFTVDEARAVNVTIPGGHCKNLFLKDEKGQLWLIVALDDAKIDLKAAKDRIGSKRLTFSKPELLLEVLGVVPGSVTPFAVINDKACQVIVILDAPMMSYEILNYYPLKNDATTTISATDLVTFLNATGHPPRIIAVSDN